MSSTDTGSRYAATRIHLFNLNIVQSLADFVTLGYNCYTSFTIEKKWAE